MTVAVSLSSVKILI